MAKNYYNAESVLNIIDEWAKTLCFDGGVSVEDMALINQFARRELKAEEVYVFPVTLCDNETDRDYERFSVSALAKLAELFVGKTGILGHDSKGANQTARIFRAEVTADASRSTKSGMPYRCVKAMAYMMRTEENADLIAEIDGGIKEEASISCSVGRKICSICGADERRQPCTHIKGEYYSGNLCEKILEEPSDAYEWSFVAIPAPAWSDAHPEARLAAEQRDVLKAMLLLGFKYIAKDSNGRTYIYTSRPIKDSIAWFYTEGECVTTTHLSTQASTAISLLFEWEDKEPLNIAEALEQAEKTKQ